MEKQLVQSMIARIRLNDLKYDAWAYRKHFKKNQIFDFDILNFAFTHLSKYKIVHYFVKFFPYFFPYLYCK